METNTQIGFLTMIVTQALIRASSVHNRLGLVGKEIVKKNSYEDMALKCDIECEKAILEFLKGFDLPIHVISEEHGLVELNPGPKYLGILDGLDGSYIYKDFAGTGRYSTMFGILDGTDPSYDDYLVSGIMEHVTGRLYVAIKDRGAFVIKNGKEMPIHVSDQTEMIPGITNIYLYEWPKPEREIFTKKIEGFDFFKGCSATYYIDVADGSADAALETTRKGNLETVIAYGLIKEAGGVMVDVLGNSIGPQKYLEFGQKDIVPVITAGTQKLADAIIQILRKA